MCLDFVQRGPAFKLELQHLPGSLGRLASRPQDDEQAGDQGGVDLQSSAVSDVLRTAYSQGRIQPAENSSTVHGSRYPEQPFGGQVQLVGEQPPRLQLALVVGALYLDQSNLVPLELVFAMRRARRFNRSSLAMPAARSAAERDSGLHRTEPLSLMRPMNEDSASMI